MDVETYNRIVVSGALEGQHVELLDGTIVDMSPKSPAHISVVSRLVRHFATAPRWWMQVQDPIEIPPDSEPEPDIVLSASEPAPGTLLRRAALVVEVALSSQSIDRNVKSRLYARAGIPTYWLIDVQGYKRFTWFFVVFGTNAITAYIMADFVPHYMGMIKIGGKYLYDALFVPYFTPVNASLVSAVFTVLAVWVVMWVLYRFKIIIKV